MQTSSFYDLVHSYEGILFDAYGVLVNNKESLSGAKEAISYLRSHNMPFRIVTNGSSLPRQSLSHHYLNMGLEIHEYEIISSGELAKKWLKDHLDLERVLLLGPSSSEFMLSSHHKQRSPGDTDFDVVVIGHRSDGSIRSLETMIGSILKRLEILPWPVFLLPNCDVLYPKGSDIQDIGITSGMIAAIIQAAVAVRYSQPIVITRLGKPHAPIFEEAIKDLGTRQLLMIGDQILTDIKGAHHVGLDSALVATGIGRIDSDSNPYEPTYFLKDLN